MTLCLGGTRFKLSGMKYFVSALFFSFLSLQFFVSSIWALEPCSFERRRAVDPPGATVLKIHVGKGEAVKRVGQVRELIDYLKQADGKICQVDWLAARKEMEDWLSNSQIVEERFGAELLALSAKQNTAKTGVQPAKTDDQLAEVRARVSALGSRDFDSTQKRRAALSEIMKILESIH